MIKQLSRKTVYENKWMKVREDSVEFSNGKKGIYGVVDKPDFAMVIPFENGGFYLVKQYRYPVEESYWEFPQGSYEDDGNINPTDLAKNELREETGLSTNQIKDAPTISAYGLMKAKKII